MVLENFLDWVVPDPHECRRAAERLRAEYAGQELSDEELAKRAVASARRWAAGAGAATGAAANPLIAIPAAMADMAAVFEPVPVRRFEDVGWDSKAFEAIAFALLAYQTAHGRPGNVPAATGAKRVAVLGKIIPGRREWTFS